MVKFKKLNIIALILLLVTTLAVSADDGKKAKERNEVRAKSAETLAKLYKVEPNAKEAVESAYGYATFSNFGMKILIAGGGKGQGLAVNNQTGTETFMRMIELQAGLGMGIKKFRVIFVFGNESAFNDFINSGWEFGGQTTAAAKLDDDGGAFAGAVSVSPGVWVYQMTDDGLALELTMKGTKYMKDDKLNQN
jgi:lipid-binding SYLF domain-containing protein